MISMHRKRRLCWIVSGFLLLGITLFSQLSFAGNWKSAVVIGKKGIVYSSYPKKHLPPASTVKILTAMVVIDHINVDNWIKVSRKAADTEPSKVYLKPGEEYRVKDLVYALLMASANDAAVALAEAVAKREDRFAELMNKKAIRCGAKNSLFKNASGLPAKGAYSCAYDLAKLMRTAVKYGLIVDALSRKTYHFYSKSGRKIRVVNHNKLLWNRKWRFIKGKTGFTRNARQCFVGFFYKGKELYTFAFLGGKTLWNNIKELYYKANKTINKKTEKEDI